MFNRDLLFRMKKGAYLVNTARGKIIDTNALVEVLEKGHLAGYAGDVWSRRPWSIHGDNAQPWDGAPLLWHNHRSTKKICRWDKKVPFGFFKRTSY